MSGCQEASFSKTGGVDEVIGLWGGKHGDQRSANHTPTTGGGGGRGEGTGNCGADGGLANVCPYVDEHVHPVRRNGRWPLYCWTRRSKSACEASLSVSCGASGTGFHSCFWYLIVLLFSHSTDVAWPWSVARSNPPAR